jgi:predicted outer membrane protein
MRKFFLPAAAAVLLAVPALATAQRGDEGPDRSQPRFERVTLGVAKADCRQEARSMGRDAFVAKFGSERPRRACVEANLSDARARVNAATDTCKTEAADGGRQAFREKYGNRPFRRCVRAELQAGMSSPESG